MNRKLQTITFLLFFCVVMWAQNSVTPRLVVWQKSGEKVYYELSEMPETTFENGMLVIRTSSNSVGIQYLQENILRYTYEGVATGVELMANEHSVSINHEGNTVTFEGLKEGSEVHLFASNGMLLESLRAVEGRRLILSVDQRPAGVYLVKCGSETIKLMKR